MEEFLDPYPSFPSWTDENLNERSWAGTEFNPLLPISTGLSQNDEESPLSMISSLSTQNPEALAAQDDSSLVSGVDCGEQMGCENFDNNPVKWFPNGRVVFGNLNLQRNEAAGVFSTSVSFAQDGSFEITDSNSCPFGTPLGELETLSPVTAYWSLPPSECTSSLSTLMGENERQSSHFQEGTAEDAGHVGKYAEFDDILQPGKLLKGQQGLPNCTTEPFAAGPQITNNQIIQSLPQMVPTTSKGDANGVGKHRVRARRGQATDPHSIAERLRRERISERMKNLQELVPNSSKTDKASMLDKIIEYVKFLQLEVKVLSMSRFGAAGAVVPLFTDGPAEVSDGLSFSPWAGREQPEFSPSPEHTALEQEVVKLMESNVTSAMQYLQNKGLCLIPVALAATISSGKASSTSCNSKQMKKSGCTNGLSRNSRHSTSSDSNNNAHGMDGKAKQRSSVSRLPQ